MINIHSPIITQNSEVLYKTINYRNNKIPFITQNKVLSQKLSSKFFSLKNKNSDEDDTKHNQNFKIFMNNLFKKEDEINEISCIHSNNIFFGKEKNSFNIMSYNYKENYNNRNFISSRNHKNKKCLSKINNTLENKTYNKEDLKNYETEKRSIGSECNLMNIYNDKRNENSRNYTFRKLNSIFGNNASKNIQTFSFQEFDGKMLSKIRENNYFNKIEKNSKRNKKLNSFNCIRKIIPKDLIPQIMFQSNNIMKREKENKMKLLAMKENAILFLKDKSNIINSKNIEKKNSINSYGYTNEKKNLTLSKNYVSNLKNFPLIKLKLFYNDKNIMKYMRQLDLKDKIKLAEIKVKNT